MPGFLAHLVGSMSCGADSNPTVAMMDAAFANHHLPWRYVNTEVAPEDLRDAVAGARALGFRGFNVSMPHKVVVVDHLHRLGRSAAIIGAVNCVTRDGAEWVGENTDGAGFVASLRTVVDPAGHSVTVLGAGGAARAIAVELALAGAATVHIVNRDADRGAALAQLIAGRCGASSRFQLWDDNGVVVPAECTVLVNATSIGFGDPTALPLIDLESLRPELLVADVVVTSRSTRLLDVAAGRGCPTLDGLGMLVEQGALAVLRWTGIEPDRSVMRAALEAALAYPAAIGATGSA